MKKTKKKAQARPRRADHKARANTLEKWLKEALNVLQGLMPYTNTAGYSTVDEQQAMRAARELLAKYGR
jgi:hypothetical protein